MYRWFIFTTKTEEQRVSLEEYTDIISNDTLIDKSGNPTIEERQSLIPNK